MSPFLSRFATGREFAAAIIHAYLEAEPLGPDCFEWKLLQLPMLRGTLQIGQNGARAASSGVIEESGITLALVVEPRGPHYFNGHDLQNAVIFYQQDSELCAHSTSPAFWATIRLEQDRFDEGYQSVMGCSFSPVKGNSYVVEPLPGHLESLRGLLRTVVAAAEADSIDFSSSATRQALEESLVTAIMWGLRQGRVVPRKDCRQRAAIVRRARSLMRAAVSSPPSIEALCQALEVNERTLFYAFRELMGMSPKRYLKHHRLTLARDILVSRQETSVGDVAARFGFFELGRFAGDYKSLFGELPSDTLRRTASLKGP